MVAIKDYVSLKPGTHCVYAWKSSGGRRLIYCQVVSLEGNTVTVKLPMRNQPGHILLVVPLDRTRFQTLPNRLVGKAKDSYQLKSIKDLPSVVKRAFKSGDVPIPTAISATSAVGVYGGAELMKRYQIITLGYKGGAPMGVLGLAALPGVALSIYALQKVTEIENDPIALMVTRVGLAIGNAAGLAAACTAVSRAGPVAGLSGRGIVTGLASLGGRKGGITMGLVACSGLFAVVCMAVGGVFWGVTRRLRSKGLDTEYKKFTDRWRVNGYKGPIEGAKVEFH